MCGDDGPVVWINNTLTHHEVGPAYHTTSVYGDPRLKVVLAILISVVDVVEVCKIETICDFKSKGVSQLSSMYRSSTGSIEHSGHSLWI